MTNKPFTFFLVKTQFENIGDALINRELISFLSRHSQVEVFTGRAPEYFIDQLKLQRSSVKTHAGGFASLIGSLVVRRLMGKRVFFFLAPGGNVGEKSKGGYLLNQGYNGLLAMLKFIGVKVVQFGSSYETLGPRYRKIVLYRSRSLHAFIVRDKSSLDYLNSLGVRPTGIAPDLAFGLRYAPQKNSTEANSPLGIAFSFRTDGKHISKETLRSVVETVAAKFPSARLTFVSQVKRDEEFMTDLFNIWSKKDSGRVSFFDGSETVDGCSQIYSEQNYLLSNRLHALLIGLSAGCTPIATLYSTSDFKIRGIFEGLGATSHLLELDRDWQLNLSQAFRVNDKLSSNAATLTAELGLKLGRIFQ